MRSVHGNVFFLLAQILPILLLTEVVQADTTYTIVPLLYGTEASPINNSGQVLFNGLYGFASGPTGSWLYSNGVLNPLDAQLGSVVGLNANGQFATNIRPAPFTQHAAIYSGGTMTDIGTLGGDNSTARAINDKGQIVGWSDLPGHYFPSPPEHAFLYSGGAMTDIGTLGGSRSDALGINANEQIVGWSYITGDTTSHAFLYSGGMMTDIGTLGGYESYATSINDSGQIVGSSTTSDGHRYAFLYSNGSMIDLGAFPGFLDSYARSINDNGQVVGDSGQGGGAFLYSNGHMIDLNTLVPTDSGWHIYTAASINDNGQIVGFGQYNGASYSYLMTPVTTSVPVPAAIWLFGSALAGLIGLARRNRVE